MRKLKKILKYSSLVSNTSFNKCVFIKKTQKLKNNFAAHLNRLIAHLECRNNPVMKHWPSPRVIYRH